ncbi:protein FAR1-RELATED SEQUENCE 5-like [Mangifera indica]|uniref:protein FAR1-RELATED SEQUENCE 5-like n=1 Tax=Mangifera indica TaxID=29780 RepID=UPI001CFA7F92|nr:protein FAR1-RELATED SEQUENCE 5-like [Mangifera indica]
MEFMQMEMHTLDESINIYDDNLIPQDSTHFSISLPQPNSNLEPFEGMQFESEEAAKAFYNSYARRVGFSTRVSTSRCSRRDGAIIQRSFVCAKEGFRVDKDKDKDQAGSDARVKRPRAETRVGCKAMLVVKIQDSGKWIVSSFVKEHNHELVPPDKVRRDKDRVLDWGDFDENKMTNVSLDESDFRDMPHINCDINSL